MLNNSLGWIDISYEWEILPGTLGKQGIENKPVAIFMLAMEMLTYIAPPASLPPQPTPPQPPPPAPAPPPHFPTKPPLFASPMKSGVDSE